MDRRSMSLYALSHFFVDFACALLVQGRLGGGLGLLLIYNFCAFALQMPLGLLADRLNRNRETAAGGCLLLAAAYALPGIWGGVAAGVGNALFHLGGGLDCLNHCRERCAPLGLFVAPGALGVFLGGALRRWEAGALWALPPLILALLTLAILRLCRRTENAPLALRISARQALALLCLFAVVALRSWAGTAWAFPWKTGFALGLAAAAATAAGKALGGLAADRFGERSAAAGSLGLSAALFLASALPLPGLLATGLFQMTMPLSLWAAGRLLPGAKGFVFGMLTFALFLGYLPGALGWQPSLAGPGLLAAQALASLPPLLWGLAEGRRQPC